MTPPTTQALAAGDVMHAGVITASPQTSALEVAAQMAAKRVHCVIVEGLARDRNQEETLVWGILSDLDLVKALAAERLDASAGELAATEIVTVERTDRVEEVARLMAEHECTHLVVVSPREGEPVGVISSLDIARWIAGSRESPA